VLSMASAQNETQRVQHEQGPDTISALRKMLLQDPRIGRDDTAPKEFHDAPSISPAEPSIELNPQQAILQGDGTSSDRPSVGRRVFHTVAHDFIVIIMVGAVFFLLSFGDDKKKDIVSAWDLSLSWLSSVLRTNSSQVSDVAAEPVSKTAAEPVSKTAAEPVSGTSDQKSSQNTALLPEAPSIQSAPVSVATGLSSESQHQLEMMASDLAIVRHVVEQLAARQDQMAQDIATLQAPEQKVSPRHRRSLSLRSSASREKVVGPINSSRRASSPLGAYPNRLRADDPPIE
jgi:hypothetical protein